MMSIPYTAKGMGDKIDEGKAGALRDMLLFSWHWWHRLTCDLQSLAIFDQ